MCSVHNIQFRVVIAIQISQIGRKTICYYYSAINDISNDKIEITILSDPVGKDVVTCGILCEIPSIYCWPRSG